MTEKEMIEEMQKVMEYCCNVYDDKGNHIRNKCNSFDCEYYDKTNGVCCSYSLKEAKALYKQGYRKLHEGSVVLSKEEYEILINQNKGLKEENHTLRLENNDLEAQVEKARKVTAKEILKLVKQKSWCYQADGNGKAWTYSITVTQLKDIAKQFGVEIKE